MDSEAFVRLIVEWRDFFLATAAAAATLVGLLFVGLSLNVDEVMAAAGPPRAGRAGVRQLHVRPAGVPLLPGP
jgi:hypothetical protein